MLKQTEIIPHFKWKFYGADWTSFYSSTEMIKYDNAKNCSENLKDFTSKVLEAAKKYIPSSTRSGLHSKTPWWNQDCKVAKRNRNRMLRKFQTSRNPADFIDRRSGINGRDIVSPGFRLSFSICSRCNSSQSFILNKISWVS